MSAVQTNVTPRAAIEAAGFVDRMPGLKLPKAPPTRVSNLIFWLGLTGLGLFGGLGTWAATAPISSAVVASGAFRVVGDRLAVQHLEGGILREISVREGERVEEGQVLARLDPTVTFAQIAILESQLASALAQDERLRAEHREEPDITLSAELIQLLAADPGLQPLVEAQLDVFGTNNTMLAGQVQILRGRIAQLEERLAGIAARRDSLLSQLELTRSELADLDQLQEQGLVTRSRLTLRRQDEAAILGDLGQTDSDALAMHQQIAEFEERILQLRRDRQLEIADERQQVQSRILDLRQRLSAMHDVGERLAIRAPRSGRVVNLEINTLGGVVSSGQNLLEIVPEDADILVEARVSPSDIDEVVMGGTARVRLSAYSFRSTPPVGGTVTNVSADSLFDAGTGEAYYRVDVAVSEADLEALPHIRTLPGMPADVMIETGAQTLVEYLIGPIIGSLETGLKESD